MKRTFLGIIIGGIGGTLLGFAIGVFVYPFWFLNDVASEKLVHDNARIELAKGKFIHVNPSDPVHWGKGGVTLYRGGDGRSIVHLEDDFQVGPGPAFHLYLVDHAKVRSAAEFKTAEKIDLGRIRAFRGSQIYSVPTLADITAFKSAVIWCKEFGVLISPARLDSGLR